MEREREVADAPARRWCCPCGRTQRAFENVRFAYDRRGWAHHSAWHQLRHTGGQDGGGGGPSGAGKSTLARLLYRFYDVSLPRGAAAGGASPGGRSASRCGQDGVRRASASCRGITVLFNDTVEYNIALWPAPAPARRGAEAARRAHPRLHRRPPRGYATMVGERGPQAVRRREAALAIAAPCSRTRPS